MTLTMAVHGLLDYTAWERREWLAWFSREGRAALATTTGPHGDGRFPTVGALVRHIFSAELRYVERILKLPLTDTASVPIDTVDPLFQFGDLGRTRLLVLIDTLPERDWEAPLEFPLLNSTVRVSPRKIVLHLLTHELRHWAQVATLLRLQGRKCDRHDLLFSPVLGDPVQM